MENIVFSNKRNKIKLKFNDFVKRLRKMFEFLKCLNFV
ncbi:hypothetical protein FEM21_31000 [Flavobacterium seoulense]|uniref:Uncharacterized protein n=1 Tax=Flavobacterium seoulense TaxID=1492738 RepID=A0A066WMG9_9FLAO|nr:hypothetical protein FEM21_31000 [Flavobacterium seoulense]